MAQRKDEHKYPQCEWGRTVSVVDVGDSAGMGSINFPCNQFPSEDTSLPLSLVTGGHISGSSVPSGGTSKGSDPQSHAHPLEQERDRDRGGSTLY